MPVDFKYNFEIVDSKIIIQGCVSVYVCKFATKLKIHISTYTYNRKNHSSTHKLAKHVHTTHTQ